MSGRKGATVLPHVTFMSTFARDFFFADPKRSELLQIAAKAFFLVEVASLATRSRSEEQKINILEKSHFSVKDISFEFLCFFRNLELFFVHFW
jgi:hypothetical protein